MEKKEKTPKAPKAPKTPKAKKSKMPEGYIGRPKPMKTKKFLSIVRWQPKIFCPDVIIEMRLKRTSEKQYWMRRLPL